MGNAIPTRLSDATGKVILLDGTIHLYDKPLTVAELMLEYPQQVVIEFQQPLIGSGAMKHAPLPADKKLEMNKVYFMLPLRRGKPASLSTEEARRILLKANSFLRSKSLISSAGFLPLFARMCAAGTGERHHEHQYPPERKKKLECYTSCRQEEEETKPDYFSDLLELERPEFLTRQISGKGWKPSLDTITEKTVQTKIRHWLF